MFPNRLAQNSLGEGNLIGCAVFQGEIKRRRISFIPTFITPQTLLRVWCFALASPLRKCKSLKIFIFTKNHDLKYRLIWESLEVNAWNITAYIHFFLHVYVIQVGYIVTCNVNSVMKHCKENHSEFNNPHNTYKSILPWRSYWVLQNTLIFSIDNNQLDDEKYAIVS